MYASKCVGLWIKRVWPCLSERMTILSNINSSRGREDVVALRPLEFRSLTNLP